jgi:predicted DNA-binding transcriptional regulator AlpA
MNTENSADCQFPNGKLACSIQQFAQLTSVGRSSLYQAIKDGSLVARKMGKRTVITAPDGLRWLTSLPATNRAQASQR